MKLKIPLMLLPLVFMACSKEMPFDNKNGVAEIRKEQQVVVFKSTDAYQSAAFEIIKSGYLEFYGNEYSIALTLEEAMGLGYSAESYRFLESQLILANQFISQQISHWENDPDVVTYEIVDCTYDSSDDYPVNYCETRATVQMPSGVIEATTAGNSTPPVQVLAPHEMIGVTGHCFSPVAPVPVHIVTTDFGGSLKSKTRVLNGNITVEIGCSGTYGRIQYMPSDSYGGTFGWHGISQL